MPPTQADPVQTPRPATSRRAEYPVLRQLTTRWMDNDVLGHVNNVTYYSFFDTTITAWLIGQGMMGVGHGPMWMAAENGCRYLSEVAFPDVLTVGLRLGRLGRSSVRWELGLFRGEAEAASAEGFYVHVHVDRATRRPTPIPDAMRHTILTELDHGHRT